MSERIETKNGHVSEGKWILVPLDDLKTPRGGRIVIGPRYWAVVSRGGVKYALFYQAYYSPQCNAMKSVTEHIMNNGLYKEIPGLDGTGEVEFIEASFVPHRCSDY